MTANKWGLVATILALVGLGFAAMSTNPPFQVNYWVPSAFFIAAALTLFWLIILLVRKHKIVKIEAEKPQVVLKMGAKVNHISTYDYYAQAEGKTEFMQGKQVIVDVTLFSLKQMKIDSIEIELFGKSYPSKEPSSMIIKDAQFYKFAFDIPDEIAINTNEAQIKVLSGKDSYSSNLFEINFTKSVK